jgi:uncharacterized damage-inducible protein DinB
MKDAFAHHIWATKRLADACRELTIEQLTTEVSGTYGSILETIRHMVGDDWFYLGVLTGRQPMLESDPRSMGIAELSSAIDVLGTGWTGLMAAELDPDTIVKEVDPNDGFQRNATLGVHLAQALHHGNEHRAHICTTLGVLGVEPPSVSVFKFALETGRSTEVVPPA